MSYKIGMLLVTSSIADKKGVVISVFAINKDFVTHANIFPWSQIILEQLSECI